MQKSGTFTALNGLRFLAALAVVIFHYAPRIDVYSRCPDILKNLVSKGPAAVGFFFILSGFVLAYRCLHHGTRVESVEHFYWSRLVRLYPAYLLAFLLFLPVAVERYGLNWSTSDARHHTFIVSAVLSSLMLQAWTPLAQAWNGPSWSLSVEVFLYLLFPFIVVRLSKLSRASTALVLAIAWLLPSGLALAFAAHRISDSAWRLYVTNNPLLWLPLFVIGICASRAVAGWHKVTNATANIFSSMIFISTILISLAWPHKWNDLFVTGGIAPLLVALIVSFTRISGWITRTLGGPLFAKLGDASYAIYILQAPLWHYWQLLANFLRHVPLQTSLVGLWCFLVFLPLLVFASLAVHRFIETPFRDWAHRGKDRDSSESPFKQRLERRNCLDLVQS